MTKHQTIRFAEVQPGQTIRFLPFGNRNRLTVRVTDAYEHGAILGYRARIWDDGTVSTRGREHAYVASADTPAEVIR